MSNSTSNSVAIVGSGIAGLAHAWAAAKRGWQVVVLERDPRARGASVRNFGMVWPIGQAPGSNRQAALTSRRLWAELLEEAQLWHAPRGSLHLAYREDELAVLSEFAEQAPDLGYDCQLMVPEEALRRSPAAQPTGLLGALWSASEIGVDPRQVLGALPQWLHQRYGVQFHFAAPIAVVAEGGVCTLDGRQWGADRVIVAAGADFRQLYPDLYRAADFSLCKLQMLRTVAQPQEWSLGPMLAGGLTLRHYECFSICPSLDGLKARIAGETPELDQYGIHVMAAQNGDGEVILGDSHEYGDDPSPFDKTEIDQLILRELHRMIRLPNWEIAQRWHGVYPKKPGCIEYVEQPEANVHVVIPSGGCGMTMSFGLAEARWSQWDGEVAATTSPTRSAAVASDGGND